MTIRLPTVAELVVGLALLGCAHLPATLRMADAAELGAIHAIREAWISAGRSIPQDEALANPRIVPLAAAELEARCYGPVTGCMMSTSVLEPGPVLTLIYVRDDLPRARHLRLVQHEYAHQLRGLWVLRGGDINAGRDLASGCRIGSMADHGHCDLELWGPILDAAERPGVP